MTGNVNDKAGGHASSQENSKGCYNTEHPLIPEICILFSAKLNSL